MEESVTTFETHLTSIMDSLIRASVCEITKLFQETVNDYLVELSLNRKENDALKLRLRHTENLLRNERKYGMDWAANRRNAGLSEEDGAGRKKRRVNLGREYFSTRRPGWGGCDDSTRCGPCDVSGCHDSRTALHQHVGIFVFYWEKRRSSSAV